MTAQRTVPWSLFVEDFDEGEDVDGYEIDVPRYDVMLEATIDGVTWITNRYILLREDVMTPAERPESATFMPLEGKNLTTLHNLVRSADWPKHDPEPGARFNAFWLHHLTEAGLRLEPAGGLKDPYQLWQGDTMVGAIMPHSGAGAVFWVTDRVRAIAETTIAGGFLPPRQAWWLAGHIHNALADDVALLAEAEAAT